MPKRIIAMVVGAGIGSLVGLLLSALGAGNAGVIVSGVAGAILPLVVLGPPGKSGRAAPLAISSARHYSLTGGFHAVLSELRYAG
jgi:hypothetical protein